MARWWGDEVLDHTTGAVDLAHAREGLPLLLYHNRERQIGVWENVRLEGGKLVGEMRFSASSDAQEVRQDVLDGIRKNVSVGYRIDQLIEEEKPGAERDPLTGMVPTQFRASRWTPMEGSLVPVPADITVGVGREDDRETFPLKTTVLTTNARERTMDKEEVTPVTPAPKPDPTPAARVTGEDRNAVAGAVAALCIANGFGDRAEGFLKEGLGVEEVKGRLFDLKVQAAKKGEQPGHVDLTEHEQRTFSIGRALSTRRLSDWEKKGCLEREVSDTIGDKLEKATGIARRENSFYLPLNLMVPGELRDPFTRAPRFNVAERASVTGQAVGTNSLGGFAVATQLLPLIELLRNRMFTRALGARVLTGLTSNIAFPRQITANTLSWSGENPSSGNANTTLTLNQLSLSPKTGMVSTAFSRQLMIQSTPDIDALVMNDLAQVFALGFDLAGINGSGSGNQPTGILNTAGVNVRALGTNGAAIDWTNLVGLETDVATGNADLGALAYLTNPAQRGKMKTTLKTTVAGASFLWDMDGTINGYRAAATQQVPSNLTKGTATTICSGILFGNWEELIYGEFGGALEIIVDPYTVASQNMIQITGIGFIDVGVRHTASFSVIKDAL